MKQFPCILASNTMGEIINASETTKQLYNKSSSRNPGLIATRNPRNDRQLFSPDQNTLICWAVFSVATVERLSDSMPMRTAKLHISDPAAEFLALSEKCKSDIRDAIVAVFDDFQCKMTFDPGPLLRVLASFPAVWFGAKLWLTSEEAAARCTDFEAIEAAIDDWALQTLLSMAKPKAANTQKSMEV